MPRLGPVSLAPPRGPRPVQWSQAEPRPVPSQRPGPLAPTPLAPGTAGQPGRALGREESVRSPRAGPGAQLFGEASGL